VKKNRPVLKKLLYIFIVLLVSIPVFAYFFFKSPSFPRLVKQFINSRTDRNVEIGSISLAKGPLVIIKDLTVKDAGEGRPFMVLPLIEIGISPSVLLKRSIDTVYIKKPKFFFTPKKHTKPEEKKVMPALLFSFKKISIEEGEVLIQIEEGRSFHVSAVNLSFAETDDKKAKVSGSLFLNEFNLTVPVEAALDIDGLNIEKGRLDITLRELEKLSFKDLEVLRHKKIKGSVNLGIDIFSEDGLGVKLTGSFLDLGINEHDKPFLLEDASGEFQTMFTISDNLSNIKIEAGGTFKSFLKGRQDNHKIDFKGVYNSKARELSIENASLSSSLLGSMDIHGRLNNFPSENPGLNLVLNGKSIPLHEIKRVLKGTAGGLMYELEAEGYAGVILSVTGNLKKPDITSEAEIIYENIELHKAGKMFPGFFAEKGFTIGGKGALRSSLKAVMREGKGPDISGRADFNITRGSFSSSDAYTAAEGLNMKVSGRFEFSLPLSKAKFSVDAKATDFEFLFGSFYGDFKNRGITLLLEGNYSRINDSLEVSRSDFGIKGVGTAMMSGKIENLTESPHFTTDVSLGKLQNKNAYNFFIKDTFKNRFTFLAGIETGGVTSVKLSVKGTADRFNANGDIDVNDMYILGKKSDLSVQGINISMPFNISYPEVDLSGDTRRFGSFRIQEISKAGLHIKDFEVFPAIWKNALIFKEDISVPVFGGHIRLMDVHYMNLLSPERELAFSISLDGIELDKVSKATKMPVFSGSISGSIPRASFTGGNFRTEGEILMELFGGEIKITGLSVNKILGPVPSIAASVKIREIDLGKLSNTFEFGHVSGILQGYVRDLVITKGQAQRFETVIETVEREGVSQRISVEALEKISILGSGSAAAVLSRGVYQFFKQYRYKKMGFRGSLRNDRFFLLGIEAEGNKEYIVKGGLIPPRVNVISYTQNVSFQEMVKRLNRVELAQGRKDRETE